MKYGIIAPNESINASIYQCFEHVGDDNAQRFMTKFKQQLFDDMQVMHTFRELIVGAFLVTDNGEPICIVEVTTHHPDQDTWDNITEGIENRGGPRSKGNTI